MKLLSVVVPSYNSYEYLTKAMESVVATNDSRIELLVIDDGSKDQTYELAQSYEQKYPNIIKAITQENKGHGGAINTGLLHATGQYFKVLDSDDWFDVDALTAVMKHLALLNQRKEMVDVFFSNYVYEQGESETTKVINYKFLFPQETIFSWKDSRPFPVGKYIMMHSIMYRTSLLREIGFKLPEHTFYVDNLFVYIPLTKVQKMYYLNVNLYRYFIGREDQSVNESVMMKRIDQQLKVNYLLIDACDFKEGLHANQKRYLLKHLEIVTNISSALLNRIGTAEAITKRKALWDYVKQNNPIANRMLRWGVFGQMTTRRTKTGIWVANQVYKILRRVGGY